MVYYVAGCFNPRPARWLGETCQPDRHGWRYGGFNPRPARWLGETAWLAPSGGIAFRFNPRPARWLGETLASRLLWRMRHVSIHAQRGGWAKRAFPATGTPFRLVSIHAQRGGWAKPDSVAAVARGTKSFNPRPARWLGETTSSHRATAMLDVSIHAQRGGWAKPTYLPVPFTSWVFQSTPSAVAGRNTCKVANGN